MTEPGAQAPQQGRSPPFWREGRAALQLVFRSRLVLLILCILTFVASLQLLLGGSGLSSLDFLSSRQTKLWHMLLAFQPTLWVASLLGVLGDSERNGPAWPGPRRERLAVAFCSVFIFAIAFLPGITQFLISHSALPANVDALTEVPHLREKMFVFNSLGSLVGVLLASVILSVHVQLAGRLPRASSPQEQTVTGNLEAEALGYQRLRAQLERCLGFAGAIISSTLLNVGALRHLLSQALPTQPNVFSAAGAMGLGVYFTGFLALVYLPTAKTLSETGEALAEQLVGRSPGAGATWKQWSEERKAVRTWLGLESSALQEFQQGFALLSPLITSLSTLLLNTGR